ncbi:hypothetical protein [Actinomyces weissii]|uniref:Uncharacterized protein n=1 Tax=Actinomyces weissii TaxID=675090 RepID=A0A7T7MB62_9ACTO|nr:hypothetical protein [Actinomyces weissii]QQM67727.1 hypothetical protein JG540_02265 [Actinomyces weissii]
MPRLAAPPPHQPLAGPRARARRSSRAVAAGVLLTVCASGLLAWSAYTLLASLRVFAVLLGEASLLNGQALGGLLAGALLALVACVLVLVGVVRSRPRWVPALLLVVSLVLPAVATAAGLHQGGQELERSTLASVNEYASRIEPEDVNTVYDYLESFGIKAPGREQVVEGLRQAREVAGTPTPDPEETP